MGKKSRAKQSGKAGSAMIRHKKELLKMASDIFKLCVQSPSSQNQWDYYLEVRNAVQVFQLKQKAAFDPPVLPPTDRSSAIPKFKEWLKERGANYSSIDIQHISSEEGFGIVALEDIEIKSLIMAVPRHAMMTYEDAKTSYLADLIAGNEVLSVMPNVCLALYLHCEKFSPTSKFKPYIDMIPLEFNTTLYFEPDELKYLKGSASLSGAINQYKSIVRQFALLYQVFNGSHQKADVEKIPIQAREAFTFDAYRWCVSAITTRQNKLPTHIGQVVGDLDKNSTLALIPLWDMFNHAVGPLSTAYNSETSAIECLAMQDFKMGEQVKICYGSRTNSDLLIHNGFVLRDSPFDKVKMHLGVSRKDPLYTYKAKLLARLQVDVSGQFSVCSMDNSLPTSPQLLVFLRVFSMTQDDLATWLMKEDSELTPLREIYISEESKFKNDVHMWEYLENRVKLLLMAFKNVGEGDIETMLEDASLSHRSKLALQLRAEEKRILSACVTFCHQFRHALNSQTFRTSGFCTESDSMVLHDGKDPTVMRQENGNEPEKLPVAAAEPNVDSNTNTTNALPEEDLKNLNVRANEISLNPDTWMYD